LQKEFASRAAKGSAAEGGAAEGGAAEGGAAESGAAEGMIFTHGKKAKKKGRAGKK
jgi:hypothetical protein